MSLRKPNRADLLTAAAAACVIIGGSYIASLMFEPSGPIMSCDPATELKAGMLPAEVRTLCGDPDGVTQISADWYPLRGETRENRDREFAWRYGSIRSRTRNVNLYFRQGALQSVQIFGDYK